MNSIKQRKHNTPSPVDDNIAAPVSTAPRRTRSQDYNNHNAVSSKWKNRALIAIGITFALFVGKGLKESFFRAPTSSSLSSQQQLNRSSNNDSRLRAQPQPPLINDAKVDVQQSNQLRPFPYSKLQAVLITEATAQQQIQQRRQQIPPNYGRTPLTGSFTLGAEYHLSQNTAGGDDENDTSAVGGIIYFPYADLSILLPEDVTSSSFNLFGFVSTQQDVDKVFPSVLVGNNINNNSNNKQSLSKKQAILTRCGYKPSPSSPGISTAPNQDRSFIANFFLNLQPNIARDEAEVVEGDMQGPTALLMGIYDGHGGQGHVVSHFVALELPRIFTRKLIQSKDPQTTVGSSQYDEYITQIFKDAYVEVDSMEPVKGSAGCTASSLFYPGEGTKAYVANVGDSTTMIVKYTKSTKQSTIVHQNRKHKPHLLDEKVRINAAGGEVMIPPSLRMSNDSSNNNNNAMIQESSRLLVPDPSGAPFGGMALAMSRAIGDSDAKVVGLISEPEVDVWDLNYYHKQQQSSPEQIEDSEWFAVVASDGMYDVVPPEEVANLLGQSVYSDENDVSPLEACEQLIRKATLLWMNMAGAYRDDISLGVSRLEFT
eukprot:scaffold15319_cov117-Skeletonema_marinoi.AAC.2